MLLPVVDAVTWYAHTEFVDNRFQVSVLTGPGRWEKFTFAPGDGMTHRHAVTIAVERLTGHTVASVTDGHAYRDRCTRYRVTVLPTADGAPNHDQRPRQHSGHRRPEP